MLQNSKKSFLFLHQRHDEFKLNNIDIELGKDVAITADKQREHKNVIEWTASLFILNKENGKDRQQHSHSTEKEDKEKKEYSQ